MVTVVRTARKAHHCVSCDRPAAIQPGDRYREWTSFPSDEFPWDDVRPVRARECRDCSARYARTPL